MKIIAFIMLSVFALDMLAASYLMHSWIAGVLLLPTFVTLFLLWPGGGQGHLMELAGALAQTSSFQIQTGQSKLKKLTSRRRY